MSTDSNNNNATTTEHKHTNRLIHEKSPYLLQHAHNPVDWHPWSNEAFELAKKEDKLIFLSVGYSTCHWCHVMEKESFENEEIAKIMNDLFINIKVDREERPDIDKIYMTYITETSGSGGWPMSVWLTPDLQPITGGTYFPPKSKYGRSGFPDICKRLAELWKTDRPRVIESGASFLSYLKEDKPKGNTEAAISAETIKNCHTEIIKRYDEEFGGFSDAPKFPRTSIFNFLHRVHNRFPESKTLEKLQFTLDKMSMGGIYDHLGGGFHRYSVTEDWKVPHFEKMLYDQGQIASVYLDAYQISKNEHYKQVAIGIIEYVLKDLTHHEGGFYSAEDADSLKEDGSEKGEGVFYVWDYSEIKKIITNETDLELFNFMFGITPSGNVSPSEDPHGEFLDKNIIMQFKTEEECSNKFNIPIEKVRESINKSKSDLLKVRVKRTRPHLDDKIITSWNALMISALAKSYQILGEKKYLDAAKKAVSFIKQNLYIPEKTTLIRNYREGPSKVEGFTDDYAFLIQALLDLYESCFDIEYLDWAVQLQKKQDELFWDKKEGGYFSSSGLDKSILSRLKEEHDGAEPSCQSVACSNLIRLGNMLHEDEYLDNALELLESVSLYLHRAPIVFPQMVCSLDSHLNLLFVISFAADKSSEELKSMLNTVHSFYIPNKSILLKDTENPSDMKFFSELDQHCILLKYTKINDHATAYICSDQGCLAPANNEENLKKACNLILSDLCQKK